MDLALLVYAISLLNGIHAFWLVSLILCGAITFFLAMYRATECDERSYYSDKENEARIKAGTKAVYWLKFTITGAILSAWIMILLPTEKTAYTMVGAYAAQRVSENDKVQQMSGKVLTIIEQKLDGYIDQGIKEAEKKVSDEIKRKTKSKE